MKGIYRKDYTVTHELQNRSSSIKLAELGELLGPPPVLPPVLAERALREVIQPIAREDVTAFVGGIAAQNGLEADRHDIDNAVARIFAAAPPDGPGRAAAIHEGTRQLVEAMLLATD